LWPRFYGWGFSLVGWCGDGNPHQTFVERLSFQRKLEDLSLALAAVIVSNYVSDDSHFLKKNPC
jgi:hypothetical protein